MTFVRTLNKVLITIIALISLSANATIILATDFNDRTVIGDTASDLNWTYYGISTPGDLSADFSLFTTSQASDLFVVNSNIVNESPWTVDISLNVLSEELSELVLSLDAFIFSNHGLPQGVQRNLDLTANLLNSSNDIISSIRLDDIYANNGAFLSSMPNGSSVEFDFIGARLLANNTYTLRIFAEGQGYGNNAGFDNLQLVAKVPEPLPVIFLAIGLITIALRKRSIITTIKKN
jgi:hypothetical protein